MGLAVRKLLGGSGEEPARELEALAYRSLERLGEKQLLRLTNPGAVVGFGHDGHLIIAQKGLLIDWDPSGNTAKKIVDLMERGGGARAATPYDLSVSRFADVALVASFTQQLFVGDLNRGTLSELAPRSEPAKPPGLGVISPDGKWIVTFGGGWSSGAPS